MCWLLEECETDDIVSELSPDDGESAIDIDEAFTKHASLPGTVKIIVESTTFWYVNTKLSLDIAPRTCQAHSIG